MTTELRSAVWRVTSPDGSPHERAFDALILPSEGAEPRRWERHLGLSVPFEGQLSDVPLTLIVQAHADIGPLNVEYRAFAPDGTMRVMGRSTLPLAVIVRTAKGIHVGGLPGTEPVADQQGT